MPIVNNKEEFENFYPYSKDQIQEYPKEYPCVVKWENEDFGLMGDSKVIYVAYFPKDMTSEQAFYYGLWYNWTHLK